MTVVIACQLFPAIAVVADCRVSYPPPYEEVDDCLQKLYQIEDRLVMGFAGPLKGAYKIMALVRDNVQSYSKPPIADNLQRDAERWIRHKYREIDEPDRKGLSFILATVEPRREQPGNWFLLDEHGNLKPSSRPSWWPFLPEWKIIALRPSQSEPTKLVREEGLFAKIIGVNDENRKIIEEVLVEIYQSASEQPALQMLRLLDILQSKVMARQIKRVGGLLQGALLSENGIEWFSYVGDNVALEFVKDRFVQRNTQTGQTLPLMTIWEWEESQPAPGSFGGFEDPDFRDL
jgi:hypothetical protein